METGKDRKLTVAILTISTSCSRGEREDASGEVLWKLCSEAGFSVIRKEIVPDDRGLIEEKLSAYSDRLKADLVLTTGGTGLGPYDLTPQATAAVAERIVPGLSELIRQAGGEKTRRAYLSRGRAVTRGETLIVNLPGSPRGASESLQPILELIPHALAMMKGGGHD